MPITKENAMKPKALLITCPCCKRVKRYGEWIELNQQDMTMLAERQEEFSVLQQLCHNCEE